MSFSKRLTLIFLLSLGLSCYGQDTASKYPKAIIYDGDTVVIFDLNQAKEMAKRNESLKGCMEEYGICELQLQEAHEIIALKDSTIADYRQVDLNNKAIIKEKDDLIKLAEEENVILRDDVKAERNRKRIAIIGGSVATGLMTYLWITK